MEIRRTVFVTSRFFLAYALVVISMVIGFFVPPIVDVAWVLMSLLFLLSIVDLVILFSGKNMILAERLLPLRFSNGDQNHIRIKLLNNYPLKIKAKIIDEVPVVFQYRNLAFDINMQPHSENNLDYELRPVKRGVYSFGSLRVFVHSQLELISLRYTFPMEQDIDVFPSFLRLQEYNLDALHYLKLPGGIKQIRRLGHTMEFENIREYVQGDDWRSINWKATSRSLKLMTNQYIDEKSQQIYCVIDTGRSMRMPFNGLTLLDYAINASLALTYVVLQRHDRAGLIVSAYNKITAVQASNNRSQLHRIMKQLFDLETDFPESDFGYLQSGLRQKVSQRSLIILFTNFESKDALFRQLQGLQAIAKNHLLLVVGFMNTELESMLDEPTKIVRDVYDKAIAEHMILEKKRIQYELKQRGILSLLVTPQELNIKLINKYLEIKSRSLL